MCKRSTYMHKMLLNTRGTASIVLLICICIYCMVQVSLSVAMSGRTGAEQLGARAELLRYVCLSAAPTLASGGKSASQVDAIGQLSNGTTKPASRGEERLAAQLDVKVQRKFQGKRRVLESQATTGTSQTNSGNKEKELRLSEPDENEQHWSARGKSRWREWKPMRTNLNGLR